MASRGAECARAATGLGTDRAWPELRLATKRRFVSSNVAAGFRRNESLRLVGHTDDLAQVY